MVIIRPSFFLLPQAEGQQLGVRLYDELLRKKREILIGNIQKWGEEEWLPERIIATPMALPPGAQDGMWG